MGKDVVAYGGDGGEDSGASDSEGWVVKNETAAALASLKLMVRVLRLNLSAMVPAKRMTGIASTTITIAEWMRPPGGAVG